MIFFIFTTPPWGEGQSQIVEEETEAQRGPEAQTFALGHTDTAKYRQTIRVSALRRAEIPAPCDIQSFNLQTTPQAAGTFSPFSR